MINYIFQSPALPLLPIRRGGSSPLVLGSSESNTFNVEHKCMCKKLLNYNLLNLNKILSHNMN